MCWGSKKAETGVKMKINIILGDIAQQDTEAIVNPANKSLLGGGGADGAIHRSAGSELLNECKTLGGCKTGEVKITEGYNLKAKYVIHTVGPVYGAERGKEAELLKNCYSNSLKLAKEKEIKTISFPFISAGAYRYPKKEACEIAVKTCMEFGNDFNEIRFVLFDNESIEMFNQSVAKFQEVMIKKGYKIPNNWIYDDK